MNKINILIFVFILQFSILYSKERTVTSFFVHCKDKSCCETNLNNCKMTLSDSQQVCQRASETCENFATAHYS
jgi:hypothetical protein